MHVAENKVINEKRLLGFNAENRKSPARSYYRVGIRF